MNKQTAPELFAQAVYQAKPKSLEEEGIMILHSMLLSAGFKCIGAHEDEPEATKEIIVPHKWAEQKADGVYGFKYRSENKKFVLQVKVVCTGRLR